jgi:hypothetical protein
MKLALACLLSLSPYLYLYIAGSNPTKGSWGNTGSLGGLFTHILRQEYGTLKLSPISGASEGLIERTYIYLLDFNKETMYIGLVAVAVACSHLLPVTSTSTHGRGRGTNSEASIYSSKAKSRPSAAAIGRISSDSEKGNKGAGTNTIRHRQGGGRGGAGKDTNRLDDKITETVSSTAAFEPVSDGSGNVSISVDGAGLSVAIWGVVWTFVFYILVFHSLANLPLDSPMPFAVHARFWMQPNIILCIFSGCGVSSLIGGVEAHLPQVHRFVYSTFCTAILWVSILYYNRNGFQHRLGGSIVGYYGLEILTSLPPNSLVLSHTDLNWNTVRYFQDCEKVRHDVLHISAQLINFPWFRTVQVPLYEERVYFPSPFPGVNTQRQSRENARLIADFARGNFAKWDNIFIDMHGINDLHLGTGGSLGKYPVNINDASVNHPFYLVPYGLGLWQVKRSGEAVRESLIEGEGEGMGVMPALRFLHKSVELLPLYPPGSWEHAACSIAFDSLYQRALFLFDHALHMTSKMKHHVEPSDNSLGDRDAFIAQSTSMYTVLKQALVLFDLVLYGSDTWKSFSFVSDDVVSNMSKAFQHFNRIRIFVRGGMKTKSKMNGITPSVTQYLSDNPRVQWKFDPYKSRDHMEGFLTTLASAMRGEWVLDGEYVTSKIASMDEREYKSLTEEEVSMVLIMKRALKTLPHDKTTQEFQKVLALYDS